MKQIDTSLFKGHRERMRAKLESFGARYFETYELVEMLLYSVIPRRNTHPTAKLLLKEFKTLERLFSAKCDELTKISGVGEECAKFISEIGDFLNFDESGDASPRRTFSSYEEIGDFFASYFAEKQNSETVILLLDANLSYVDFLKIYELDFSSGAVQAKPFIEAAVKAGASACAIAHNHPHSSPFPTDGDWETGKILKSALRDAGISLLENYVVTQEGYKRFSSDKMKKTTKSDAEEKILSGNTFSPYLSKILKRVLKNDGEILSRIEKSFGKKCELFEADIQILKTLTGSKSASELLVIIAALASRKRTEKFKFGKRHTEEEIKDFLIGYYLNAPRELFSIIPLDSDNNALGIELLGEGSVTAANIIPRAILEKLSKFESKEFILAHNHPGGAPEPSLDDIASTKRLAELLEPAGVCLSAHYVVARGECKKI